MVLERISREKMLMEMAFTAAKRGTCTRLQVGAIIARDGRVISTGYNGVPAGLPHCDHTAEEEFFASPPRIILGDKFNDGDMDRLQQEWNIAPGVIMEVTPYKPVTFKSNGCTQAEHAERNAIYYAARYGTALEGASIFTTHAPCEVCARAIINAGIVEAYYTVPYRKTEGVELLQQAGIQVIAMSKPE